MLNNTDVLKTGAAALTLLFSGNADCSDWFDRYQAESAKTCALSNKIENLRLNSELNERMSKEQIRKLTNDVERLTRNLMDLENQVQSERDEAENWKSKYINLKKKYDELKDGCKELKEKNEKLSDDNVLLEEKLSGINLTPINNNDKNAEALQLENDQLRITNQALIAQIQSMNRRGKK